MVSLLMPRVDLPPWIPLPADPMPASFAARPNQGSLPVIEAQRVVAGRDEIATEDGRADGDATAWRP